MTIVMDGLALVGWLGAWGWGLVDGDGFEGSGWLISGGSGAKAWVAGVLGLAGDRWLEAGDWLLGTGGWGWLAEAG